MTEREISKSVKICLTIGILTYVFGFLSLFRAIGFVVFGLLLLGFFPSDESVDRIDPDKIDSENDLPFRKM